MNRYNEELRWLGYVLMPEGDIPSVEDWYSLFDFACKQQIQGIYAPFEHDVRLPQDLLFEWIGIVEQGKSENLNLNRRIVQLCLELRKAGFRCCIIKGQGNGLMYPDSLLRMPGDIDAWIDASQEELYDYVKNKFPDAESNTKHIKFPLFQDVPVDAHFTPLKLYHPYRNKKLQIWLNENKEKQMTNYVRLSGTDVDVAIPTARFNLVYQLGHILIHLYDEGIGLKQIVDYYYVLKQMEGVSDDERNEIEGEWKEFGLLRIAQAIMWVENSMLGLPEKYLIVEHSEKLGKLLANDILDGGYFGKYGGVHGRGALMRKLVNVIRMIKVSRCAPAEAFFRLLGKIRTFNKKFILKHNNGNV